LKKFAAKGRKWSEARRRKPGWTWSRDASASPRAQIIAGQRDDDRVDPAVGDQRGVHGRAQGSHADAGGHPQPDIARLAHDHAGQAGCKTISRAEDSSMLPEITTNVMPTDTMKFSAAFCG
jgi:hypothetical protein